MRNQSSETTTTTVNEPKWSIKEKLYLVSSVMVNGDSNWNYVCDNLNRFVAQTTPNVSSRSLPRRTNIQCSKQYRQIVKQYTPKNGALCDLKKVYDQLKNERLTELKRQIQASRQEYNKLCTEIEQILALNSPENFLFLSQKWCNLKAQIETRRKPAVAAMFGDNDWVPTPLSNQLSSSEIEHILELVRSIAAASNLDTSREVDTNRNIERLLAFELKKVRAREEAEAAAAAAELERKKRLEEEAAAAAAEAAAAAAAAEAAAALESAMEVDEQSVKVEATSSSPDKKTERKSVESATTKTSRVEIKLESQDEEDLEKAARQTSTTTTSAVVKADADSYSSEDEPLLEIKNRQTSIHQQLSQTSASEEAAAAAKQSPSSGRPSRAGASKSRSSISVAPPTPAAAATPNTHRTRSSSKLNTAAVAATATAADSSSTTSSSHISSDEDKQPTNPVTSTSKTSARQTPVSSPSKQQQLTPTRQLTPRRHLLSSGEEPTTTGSDIVYAPQLSKESKMSIYDLDNDDVETGKSGSVQVFDLGESASADDKLSKLSKIGPVSKGSPASSTASTSTKPQRASRQTSSQKLAQTTTASEESGTGAAAQTSATSVQESQSGEGIEQATPTSEGTRTISLRSNKRNQQQQQSTPPPAKTTRKSTANLRQQQKQLDESTSKGASVSSPPPSVGESSLGGSNLVSIIKEEPIHISTTGGGGDTTAPFSSSSSASSSTSTSSSAAATAAAIVGGKFEDEKAYRAWKKSIMMALNNIACHKHATIFMHPVKDEIAPGYSSVVHRPMDLSTLKRMIESGTIKSTKEFQRDIMLMFTNAIMYNSSSHDVHKISVEMYKEVLNDIEQLLNAQEASGEDSNKPLRFKDIRSSTASERGAGGDNDRNDANESTSEIPVVNLLMKSKKEQPKEEAHNLETASLKSNSTISTPLTSNSNSNSNTRSKRGKAATAAAATSQPAETTPKSTPTAANTRKRRPSITNTPTTPSEKPEPTSTNTTSSKRRKSGR